MRREALAKNVEVLAYHDLGGKPGFQMAMQEVAGTYYLYVAHFKHPGWTILDVTDPSRPRSLRFIPGPDKAGQATLKLQVADGLMVTALQQQFSLFTPLRCCPSSRSLGGARMGGDG